MIRIANVMLWLSPSSRSLTNRFLSLQLQELWLHRNSKPDGTVSALVRLVVANLPTIATVHAGVLAIALSLH